VAFGKHSGRWLCWCTFPPYASARLLLARWHAHCWHVSTPAAGTCACLLLVLCTRDWLLPVMALRHACLDNTTFAWLNPCQCTRGGAGQSRREADSRADNLNCVLFCADVAVVQGSLLLCLLHVTETTSCGCQDRCAEKQ
jgi:hypothetical protein